MNRRFESVADCCAVDAGPAFKSALFGHAGEGIRLLRGENIEPGSLRWNKTRTWPSSLVAGYEHLLVAQGDLILGMDRPVVGAGLKLSPVRASDLPALLVQRVARIRPRSIDSRYLFHWLSAPGFANDLQRAATGTQLPHVTLRDIRDYLVPRFSADIERRIVDILEEHLTRLEDAVRSLAVAHARSRALVGAILVDMFPDVEDWSPSWRVETVGSAGRVELGRQRHPDWHRGSNMRPYLRVANVFEDRIDASDVMEMHWEEDTFKRFKMRPGQILLNEGQSPQYLGRPAMYRGDPPDVAFTNSLIRFTAHDDLLPEFALLVFRRHMHAGRFLRESRITTNIAHLSSNRLKKVEFPIPPLEEQEQIIALAAQRLDAAGRVERLIAVQRLRAKGLRRSILTAAFSGRLTGRSSDQDVIEGLTEEESA